MRLDLSIVSPAYNEEGNIDLLCSELARICKELHIGYEIIIVDDSSTDGTWGKICLNSTTNSAVRGVRLLKNSGQIKALQAGMQRATGAYILTIDADLQHPVELIPELWEKRISTGIVVGQQELRNESLIKSKLSQLFYIFLRRLSGIAIQKNVGDFRLIRSDIAKDLLNAKEDKIFRFLIPKYGYRSEIVIFNANQRTMGESKYSVGKLINLAITSVTSVTTRPLYLSVGIASICAVTTFVDFCYAVYMWGTRGTAPGWTSLIGLVSMGLTMIFAVLGIFGIYLGQIIKLITSRDEIRVSETTEGLPRSV
jgi:dolichol-phosphate mannosyltransferase